MMRSNSVITSVYSIQPDLVSWPQGILANLSSICFYISSQIEFKEHSPNFFDQICINYINEKMQHFFIELVLTKEKNWYEAMNRRNWISPPFHFFMMEMQSVSEKYNNKMACLPYWIENMYIGKPVDTKLYPGLCSSFKTKPNTSNP